MINPIRPNMGLWISLNVNYWRNQNEVEEAMVFPKTKLLRFLVVIYINFQLVENKRKEQSDSRRRQWLSTALTGTFRTKFWLRYWHELALLFTRDT